MLLIHIGYYRTASTFLQKRVFPIIDKDFKFKDNLKIALENIVYPNSMRFNEKEIRNNLKNYISLKGMDNKTRVFSYECLTGHPYSGGANQNEILQRLKKIFPSAFILLIFREQRDHIKSMYKKYVKDGGKKNINFFLEKRSSFHSLSFTKSYLNYYDLITKYQKTFGKKKVLALPYELLKYSPNNFISEISEFLNTKVDYKTIRFEKVNESSETGLFELDRIINNFYNRDPIIDLFVKDNMYKKYSNFVKSKVYTVIPKILLKKFEYKLENRIETFCKDYFCENNKNLQKLVGFDLKKYGYKL